MTGKARKPRPDAAAATATPRTEGQRLLLGVEGSQADLAGTLGVARSAIGFWRRGEKTPAASARGKIRDAYGIDPRAWDQVPGGAEPQSAAPPRREREPRPSTTLEEVQVQIGHLLELQEDAAKATVSDRLKIIHELNDAYKTRARLERDQEMLEDRAVRQHPFWHRVKRAIVRALEAHPDAARDVAEALAQAEDA